MHTAPPLPSLIHCAHDSLQPPLATPDQLRESDAASAHVPDAGLPNCWKIGAGPDGAELDELDDPPLALIVSVANVVNRTNATLPDPVTVKVTLLGPGGLATMHDGFGELHDAAPTDTGP